MNVSTAPRPTQAERSESMKRRLIDAAIGLLNERGYTGATAAAIAERAGVTRGALQHQFGTVQGLFLEIMRYVSRSRAPEPVSPAAPLAVRVQALMNEYRLLYEGPDGLALLEIWLGAGHDEALRQEIDALMRRITERRVDHWRTVLHDVPLAPTDIETLRGVMVSALRGAAIHHGFSRDAAAAARQVEMFADMTELWLARIQQGGTGANQEFSHGKTL